MSVVVAKQIVLVVLWWFFGNLSWRNRRGSAKRLRKHRKGEGTQPGWHNKKNFAVMPVQQTVVGKIEDTQNSWAGCARMYIVISCFQVSVCKSLRYRFKSTICKIKLIWWITMGCFDLVVTVLDVGVSRRSMTVSSQEEDEFYKLSAQMKMMQHIRCRHWKEEYLLLLGSK